MAVLLAVFWGGMAAMIGKKFGKHKLQGKMIEGTKSVEGSIAMVLTSFVCTLVVLLTMSSLAWYISLIFSLVIAPVASLTELFTKKGLTPSPYLSCRAWFFA